MTSLRPLSSPFFPWFGVLVLPLAGVPGAPLRAQEPPPMSITVEVGNQVNPTEIAALDFLRIRCQVNSLAAGVWSIPVVDFYVSGSSFFSSGPSWSGALQASSVPVSSLLPPGVAWSSTHLGTTVFGRNADSSQVAWALGSTPQLVPISGEPLFNTGSVLTPIDQVFGLIQQQPQPGWDHGYDEVVGAFSLDGLMQFAAWERLKDLPQFLNVLNKDFFESDDWSIVMMSKPRFSILMLGVRDPSVEPRSVPLPGGQLPPGLTGYPSPAPKLTTAPQRTITFIGTGLSNKFRFWSQWTGMLQPIFVVPAGGSQVLPASGYLPRMQVALVPTDGGPRVETNVEWADYGKVRVLVPTGTPGGFYDLTEYRYRVGSGIMAPLGAWKTMPTGYRPRFLVQ